MPRRPHRKSRNGCVGCKKRHIKCNENHPSCSNCLSAEMTCVYQRKVPISSSVSQSPGSAGNHSATSLPSPTATTLTYESPLPEIPPLEQGIVNMFHLELLHHARTALYQIKCFRISKEESENAIESVLGHALASPYLMHEILSIAAAHLSTMRPTQKAFLQHQATELQTSALSMFNASLKNQTPNDDTPSDFLSRFVFSSLLGTQMLHDTIIYRTNDFNSFLDTFVGYLHVTRGVNLQVQGTWHLLRESALKPFLEAGERCSEWTDEILPECADLERLLKSADLGPSAKKAYEKALACLKAAFKAQREVADIGVESARSSVFAWPVMVSTEYTELIMQRRPEALAILAHYAILLHYYRDSWMIADGGRYMIKAITKHLGTYWEPWLASPNAAIDVDSLSFRQSPLPSIYPPL